MKKEAPLIVEFTNEDVLVAKQALAALTRLRNMSFNPFTEPEKGHQLKEDEITMKKAFELLGIPGEYDSSMLDYLQRVSRKQQYRSKILTDKEIIWIFKK